MVPAALDFLAALCTHIPDTGQQLVRYYGAFSNVRRAQAGALISDPAAVPTPPGNEDGGCADEFGHHIRSSWARLIRKVYEADPLVCPAARARFLAYCRTQEPVITVPRKFSGRSGL